MNDNSEIDIKFNNLKLVFAPKDLELLVISGFLLGKYVLDDMKNLTTIEYERFSNNYVDDFKMNSKKNCNVKEIKILGRFALMEDYCLSNFDSLEIVEFGEYTKIFYISKYAFKGCKKLAKIIIPDTCIIIKEGAFKDCIGLKSVEFREIRTRSNKDQYLKIIEKEAFYNCKSLSTFYAPPTIDQIQDKAFMNCINLKNFISGFNLHHYNIKDKNSCIASIGECAFKNCSSLKSFKIPESCVSVGKSAFMNCTNLETILIKGKSFSNIQYRTFYNCTSLKKFIIKVNYYFENFFIGYQSFMNCISLKEFIIDYLPKNSKIEEIEKNDELFKNCCRKNEIQFKAFFNCKSLEKVRLFIGNLQQISADAFSDCNSLQTLEVNTNYQLPLFIKKLNHNSFVNVNEMFKIKIFNNMKEIKSLNLKEINKTKITRRRYYKEHFSHLNTSFLTDEIRNEEEEEEQETNDQEKKARKRFVNDDFLYLYTSKKEVFTNYKFYNFSSLNHKKITIGERPKKSIFDIITHFHKEKKHIY